MIWLFVLRPHDPLGTVNVITVVDADAISFKYLFSPAY